MVDGDRIEKFATKEDVISNHLSIIQGPYAAIMCGEPPEKIENLAVTHYGGFWPENLLSNEGDGHGLFKNGIDMSLWDMNGKLLIISTADDVTFAGLLRPKSDLKSSPIYYNIWNEQNDVYSESLLEIYHSRSQSVEKLLRNWAKSRKSSEGYDRLVPHFIKNRYLASDSKWVNLPELKNPLMLITYVAMSDKYVKRKRFDQNALLDWIEKNTVIPLPN